MSFPRRLKDLSQKDFEYMQEFEPNQFDQLIANETEYGLPNDPDYIDEANQVMDYPDTPSERSPSNSIPVSPEKQIVLQSRLGLDKPKRIIKKRTEKIQASIKRTTTIDKNNNSTTLTEEKCKFIQKFELTEDSDDSDDSNDSQESDDEYDKLKKLKDSYRYI